MFSPRRLLWWAALALALAAALAALAAQCAAAGETEQEAEVKKKEEAEEEEGPNERRQKFRELHPQLSCRQTESFFFSFSS